MSVRLQAIVWRSTASGATLITLLALADIADDEGMNIYPSQEYLAWKTNLSESTLRREMSELREREILIPVANTQGGRGNIPIYAIDIAKLEMKPKFDRTKGLNLSALFSKRGSNLAVKGLKSAKKPTAYKEEPLFNHPNTSSLESDDSSRGTLGGNFKKLLTELVTQKTGLPPSQVEWGARDATWLKKKLEAQPAWDWSFLERCLRNWQRSEVNHREAFWQWKDKLSGYSGGPLNAYGKPLPRAAAAGDIPEIGKKGA